MVEIAPLLEARVRMSIKVSMNDILATVTLASLVVNWLQNQPPTIFNILSVFCVGFFPSNKPLFEFVFEVVDEKPLPQPEPQEVEAEEVETQETSHESQEESQEAPQETSQNTDEELEEGEIREEMVQDKSLSSYNEALLHEVVREIIREQTTMTDDAPTQTTSDEIPVSAPSSEVPVQ